MEATETAAEPPSSEEISDETCGAFERVNPGLAADAIHSFVVGADRAPRQLTAAEAEAQLGDPFATLLLLAGHFPKTADELLVMVDEATPADDPLRSQMSFLLGEGSQLPTGPDAPGTNRGLRFLVVRGRAPEGIDLLISAFDPRGGVIEVMAWDRRRGGFNFYRSVGDGPAWVFAGNSRDALAPKTAGRGPFESHPTGNLLMKELKFPWLHWNSPAVNIFPETFGPGDDRVTHRWFTEKLGADVCELSVAVPSIERWTAARFAELVAADGAFSDPRRIVAQIVSTPTVNLVTSRTTSNAISAKTVVDLPPTFFVDSDALCSPPFDLVGPPNLDVKGELYLEGLREFGYALVERSSGFRHPSDPKQFADTHFAFAVPERALEDQTTLRAAIDAGLISRRLAACLLMVDFPNPVFSDRRAALLEHAPDEARIVNGASDYSQQMADRILAAADTTGDGSPEREFAERWGVGEDFTQPFNGLLDAYYHALGERLATRDGYLEILRLAESRRNRTRNDLPIAREFDLLFARPETNIAPKRLRMLATGAVEEAD